MTTDTKITKVAADRMRAQFKKAQEDAEADLSKINSEITALQLRAKFAQNRRENAIDGLITLFGLVIDAMEESK